MKGGRALVESVLSHGVDTVFGLPGGQTYEVFDALHARRGDVRVITSRHEQGAAYMAFGYARSSGRVGVYTVVPGPGVLNTTAALSTAYACNSPVLCLAGQVPSHAIGREIGYLHDVPDQLGVLRRLTKWAARIDHPTRAPQLVREAFRQLHTGRVRPVALEMALDVMGEETEVELLDPVTGYPPLKADPDLIERAARLLGAAKKPMILIGSGAIDAGPELLALAEILQAPVVSQRGGRGVVSDRHYLGQTFPAGHSLWAEADVALAVGTRLKYPRLHWGTDRTLAIIHIDVDPTEITRISPPTLGIVADAKVALADLIAAVERHNGRRASRKDELTALKARFAAEFERVQPQMAYLKAIREALPEDGIFVDEITQVGFASWYGFPVYRPRQLISTGYAGNLGYGFATALGVKVAHPRTPVVAISGDGGFMYTAAELSTAVKYGIALVTIVFSDGAFTNVERAQKKHYGGRVIGTELHNPDFAKYAELFGAAGFRAETPERLRETIERAFAVDAPAIIEVPVGAMANPWEFLLLPKVRGNG
jgi:acetolactate synthase-1/2/3 large subunit